MQLIHHTTAKNLRRQLNDPNQNILNRPFPKAYPQLAWEITLAINDDILHALSQNYTQVRGFINHIDLTPGDQKDLQDFLEALKQTGNYDCFDWEYTPKGSLSYRIKL